jgi:hypothetical protein
LSLAAEAMNPDLVNPRALAALSISANNAASKDKFAFTGRKLSSKTRGSKKEK